jgi:ribosomal subunit interface protein
MQLSISGHHLDITEAIKQHAEEKLSKIKHHFDHLININMILEVEDMCSFKFLLPAAVELFKCCSCFIG